MREFLGIKMLFRRRIAGGFLSIINLRYGVISWCFSRQCTSASGGYFKEVWPLMLLYIEADIKKSETAGWMQLVCGYEMLEDETA
jgi:hypothetical protein